MCVSILTYMHAHWFTCVCIYLHICMPSLEVYVSVLVCIRLNLHVGACIFTCTHAESTCVQVVVYMHAVSTCGCVYTFAHTHTECTCGHVYIYEYTCRVYTWGCIFAYLFGEFTGYVGMHECVYICTCMCAEFTCLGIHIYMYGSRVHWCSCICLQHAHRVRRWYMCVHICKRSLHVFVYISTCIYTETTCLRVYIYIYLRQVYIYVHVRINVYIHVCVCTCGYGYIFVCLYVGERHVGTYRCNVCACKYMYTYLGLYVCVYVCTSIHVCMKRHLVCMQSVFIQIQTYMSVFVSCLRVFFKCVCRYIHIYRYTHSCIHTCHVNSPYKYANIYKPPLNSACIYVSICTHM